MPCFSRKIHFLVVCANIADSIVLFFFPLPPILGHLDPAEKPGDTFPKLWCALNEGKVVVFDASTWSIQQHCFKVGSSKLVSETNIVTYPFVLV